MPARDLPWVTKSIIGSAKCIHQRGLLVTVGDANVLERQVQRLADADLFIAAAKQAIVVTASKRHYTRIPGVPDWLRG